MFRIAGSARRHGVTDDDMLHAASHPIRVHTPDDQFVMLVGPARDARLLEVGVVVDVDPPVIVHAMDVRPKFL